MKENIKITGEATSPADLCMQTYPLHNLRVGHLHGVVAFFPQDMTQLSDYAEKAKNEAEQILHLVSNIPSNLRTFNNTFYVLDAAETLLYLSKIGLPKRMFLSCKN